MLRSILVSIMMTAFVMVALGASISGTVADDSGTPYPGLEITLSGDFTYETTFTDASGNYSFTGIPVGWYYMYPYYGVMATPSEYEIYISSDSDALTGYDFTIITPPEPDAWLMGRVTFDDGSPGAFFNVQAWSDALPFSYETYTDTDGYYTLAVPSGDMFYLYCWAYGYTIDPSEYMITPMTGDTLTGLDFTVTPPPDPDATVSGRVTFSDGSPVLGAEIYAWGSSSGFSYETFTNASGDYVLPLPGGDWYYMYCWTYGAFVSSPDYFYFNIISGDSLIGYDFVMYPDTFPTEMNIEAYVSDEFYSDMEGVRVTCQSLSSAISSISYTDMWGSAYFTVHEPGYYLVTPDMAGHTFVPVAETVYVDDWEPYGYADFVGFGGASPDYGIEILAIDSTFTGVESLFVEWRVSGSPTWGMVITDDSGYAFIPLPSAGNYDLRAMHPNPHALIIPCSLTVAVDDTESIAWVIFTVNFLDGIDETERPQTPGIAISPNPFNSAVKISGFGGANIEFIEVYDISGRLVDRQIFGTKRFIVDWTPPEKSPTGVYYFKIGSGKGEFSKKAVFTK